MSVLRAPLFEAVCEEPFCTWRGSVTSEDEANIQDDAHYNTVHAPFFEEGEDA